MGNDAVGFARKEACGLEGNVLRRQFDHNFYYVTCCGRAVVLYKIQIKRYGEYDFVSYIQFILLPYFAIFEISVCSKNITYYFRLQLIKMKKSKNEIFLSASDLSNHIHCKHLTQLNKKVIDGHLEKPFFANRILDLLRERGDEFENSFLQKLEEDGYRVVKIDQNESGAKEKTTHAMRNGADYIYQARLSNKPWQGWADFLKKVEGKSNFGEWSYEVIDTKLSTQTRAGTILQITLYSELLTEIQGAMPEEMHVRTPDGEISYRVTDYLSYFRLTKKRLNDALIEPVETYPEPCSHCDICDWWEHCNKIRRKDDHLSFIAGMGNSQIKEVKTHGIETLDQMTELPLPIPFKPKRGSKHTFTKLREQARVQNESRSINQPVYEILELSEGAGFYNLPEPSKGDIYFDLEGDPLIEPNGLEYLFGWVFQDDYYKIWVSNAEKEKAALEAFIDFVFEKKKEFPALHIYHFASYETTALKRLMGKYATKEQEIDILLRTQVFVDLHRVLKQSIRAGVERYSLKDLESYHGFVREMDLRNLSKIKAHYEYLLESNHAEEITDEMIQAIELYNQEDCFSTQHLHHWLEKEREKLNEYEEVIPRPIFNSNEEPEHVSAHLERIQPIYNALMAGVPLERDERDNVDEAKFLLAHMLDWYRREEKSLWWEYYRLLELDEEELLDEKAALTYLQYTGKREPIKKSFIYEYKFPIQECDIKSGNKLIMKEAKTSMEVIKIDEKQNLIYLKKGPSSSEIHPTTLYKYERISAKKKEEQLISIAEWFVENGFENHHNKFQVTKDLLLNNQPRTKATVSTTENQLQKGIEWASVLDNSYLPIQGPPGSGKSYTGSHIILELIKKGKKIGVTALSHKVIITLLKKVRAVSDEEHFTVKMIYKGDFEEKSNEIWTAAKDVNEISSNLNNYDIVAATSFTWSDDLLNESVDYLFIDEAGQFALIDTIVVSQAAKNLVLLGDHQQLKQPIKGIHLEGTDVSALEHLLQNHKTIPKDKGLFLDKTWRMHPSICEFDADMFYDSKLFSVEKLRHQRIEGNTAFEGSGLFYKPVEHTGNTNQSSEEALVVGDIVKDLTKGDVYWYNDKNERQVIQQKDIKIISPYNSNVYELQKQLPEMEIGTVDKFQGQEAPIVIYSMASSSPEDAPRGMDFLYSPNRFNVAVSRARAAFILVGNPKLFEPECKSPDQIKLANPFCRFTEVATIIN